MIPLIHENLDTGQPKCYELTTYELLYISKKCNYNVNDIGRNLIR